MIYFIRHGESEANVRHVFAGQKDNSPLTEKGKQQAILEGKKIQELGIQIDTVVTSPLDRALSTAKIVAAAIGYAKEIIIDERITEYDMGSLTGTTMHEISSKLLVTAQNAENPLVFQERISNALQEWKAKGNILLVAHAGVGRIIETIRTNAKPELFYDIPAYPNAAIVKLDWLS